MGVRGLETFLENRPNCTQTVNIGELARLFSDAFKKKAEIVIDFSSCLLFIKGTDKPWIGGWQFKELADRLETLVKNLQSADIQVTIFMDGKVDPLLVEHWFTQRAKMIAQNKEIYNALNYVTLDHGRIFPVNLLVAVKETLRNLECKVFQSVMSCDLELAAYAKEHQCFGILAQDSDFAIFRGARHYFSMKHIDIKTLETTEYKSLEFARELDLHLDQLSILATLMGNSYVDSEDLKGFHRRLIGKGKPNRAVTFVKVANYINKRKINQHNFKNMVNSLALYCLGNSTKASILEASQNSYNLDLAHQTHPLVFSENERWAQIQKLVLELHKSAKIPRMIFSVIFHSIYYHEIGLENIDSEDYESRFEMGLTLRQKIYGILLYEKPRPVGTVKEIYLDNSGKNQAPTRPTKPSSNVDLVKLWTNMYDESEHDSDKWDLFCSTLDIEEDEVVQIEDKHLQIPIIALRFLMMEGLDNMVKDWELRAVVASLLLVKNSPIESLKAIPERPMDPKGVDLYWFLMGIFETLDTLNSVCGRPLKQTNPTAFQDGKLFQDLYRKAKDNKSFEELLDFQKSLVQSGEHIIRFIKQSK